MSRESESQFLDNLSKKLMTISSFKNAVNRNEWFRDSLKDDAFVRDMMQFAEIGNGCYSQSDISTWRHIFSKLVLLGDGLIHTDIEMDILNEINKILGKYSNLLKARFYDSENYMNYAVSAQDQSEIRHNDASNTNWIWFVRYGNCQPVDANDFANQAQFNFANGAIAFNITSFFEVSDLERLVTSAGFTLYTDPNPALDLGVDNATNAINYPRWVAVHSLSDITKLAPAILYCYKKRLADFAKLLTDAVNEL